MQTDKWTTFQCILATNGQKLKRNLQLNICSKIEEYFRFTEIEREDTLSTCKWSLYLRGHIQIEKKRKKNKNLCVLGIQLRYLFLLLFRRSILLLLSLSVSLSYKHTHTSIYDEQLLSVFLFHSFSFSPQSKNVSPSDLRVFEFELVYRPSVIYVEPCKSHARLKHIENQTTEKTEIFVQIFWKQTKKVHCYK